MVSTRDADLLVIGAGPAGCAAAIAARRAGRSVVVVDRATFPRDKTCGDGLTTGALRQLETLGVPLAALDASARITEVRVVTPTGRHIELPLPSDGEHARVIARIDLDTLLVAAARDAGATVIEGAALTGLEHLDGAVEASLDDGHSLSAPFAIAADGNYSTTRRLLSPDAPPVLGEWSAFRQYFSGVDDPRLWVLFERDLLPGYAWVFPLPNGRANVGFATPRRPGITGKVLAATWRELLRRPSVRAVLGPRAEPIGTHRAWPIPSHLDVERLTAGRVLFVGDAAGVVDPMTGEGIAQALETGVLAAEAVIAPGDGSPLTVAARYRSDVSRTLGRDLRFADRLQRVLARPFGARAALRVIDTNDWTRRHFARWMFEDYPRALLFTPDRWRRGMLTPPGAYLPT
jgi:geranylgeranyl reductase family protein